MPKQGKSPKKKTKEKSPQRTEESEYPAMDEETYNRLLRNAIEHSKAELEAKGIKWTLAPRGSRERNPLALPTLDMYLPLSKFESIQRVSIDATV